MNNQCLANFCLVYQQFSGILGGASGSVLDVFEGVPQVTLSMSALSEGCTAIDLLASLTGFLSSNSEARRALKENSISINKEKIDESFTAQLYDLICERYLLLQRGKKNYFLVVFN